MVAPVVYSDALAILRDRCAQIRPSADAPPGIPISLENDPDFQMPEPPAPWVHFEVWGEGSEPEEIQSIYWTETGWAVVHVLVPSGTGLEDALRIRHEISAGYRDLPPRAVVYRRHIFEPGGRDDELPNWYRVTLRLAWRLQEGAVE